MDGVKIRCKGRVSHFYFSPLEKYDIVPKSYLIPTCTLTQWLIHKTYVNVTTPKSSEVSGKSTNRPISKGFQFQGQSHRLPQLISPLRCRLWTDI
jgi:hypothetical protein